MRRVSAGVTGLSNSPLWVSLVSLRPGRDHSLLATHPPTELYTLHRAQLRSECQHGITVRTQHGEGGQWQGGGGQWLPHQPLRGDSELSQPGLGQHEPRQIQIHGGQKSRASARGRQEAQTQLCGVFAQTILAEEELLLLRVQTNEKGWLLPFPTFQIKILLKFILGLFLELVCDLLSVS